jgi:hypothetical protein
MRYSRPFLIGLVLLATAIQAAPARIESLAERLAQTAESLASDSHRGFVESGAVANYEPAAIPSSAASRL